MTLMIESLCGGFLLFVVLPFLILIIGLAVGAAKALAIEYPKILARRWNLTEDARRNDSRRQSP